MPRPALPIALVTGASRGIGLAIAQALAHDHQLILTARNREALERTAKELGERSGREVRAFPSDLGDGKALRDLVATLEGLDAPVQVLVNNAGVALSAPLGRTDDAKWTSTLAVNLSAPFALIRGLVPRMAEAGWGRIVNVASTAGLKGYRYTAAYAASKGGLIGLTRALALEFADKKITVNAVCPGFTQTDIASDAIRTISQATGRSADEAQKQLERFSPQRRLLEPREIADLVAYLVSDAAASINGQAIAIDGGETA